MSSAARDILEQAAHENTQLIASGQSPTNNLATTLEELDLDKETEALLAAEVARLQAEEDRLSTEFLLSEQLAQRLQEGYEPDMDSELENSKGGERPMLDRGRPLSNAGSSDVGDEGEGGSNQHHRKNHRAGVRERGRKERRAARADGMDTPETLSTPGTPISETGSDRKEESHGDDVEAMARRENRDSFAQSAGTMRNEMDDQDQDDARRLETVAEDDGLVYHEPEKHNGMQYETREDMTTNDEGEAEVQIQPSHEAEVPAHQEQEEPDEEARAAAEMEKLMEQMNAMNQMHAQPQPSREQPLPKELSPVPTHREESGREAQASQEAELRAHQEKLDREAQDAQEAHEAELRAHQEKLDREAQDAQEAELRAHQEKLDREAQDAQEAHEAELRAHQEKLDREAKDAQEAELRAHQEKLDRDAQDAQEAELRAHQEKLDREAQDAHEVHEAELRAHQEKLDSEAQEAELRAKQEKLDSEAREAEERMHQEESDREAQASEERLRQEALARESQEAEQRAHQEVLDKEAELRAHQDELDRVAQAAEEMEKRAAEEIEKAMEQMNAMNMMIEQQNEGKKPEILDETIRELEDEDKAPSLTYESDAYEDEHEEAAAPVDEETKVEVRSRADTGSFQEKVESEMGVAEHQTGGTPNKEHPVGMESNSAPFRNMSRESSYDGSGAESTSSSSQQPGSREVKLLGLKRPEVLTGGNKQINAHAIKHEIKITGLQRPIAR